MFTRKWLWTFRKVVSDLVGLQGKVEMLTLTAALSSTSFSIFSFTIGSSLQHIILFGSLPGDPYILVKSEADYSSEKFI